MPRNHRSKRPRQRRSRAHPTGQPVYQQAPLRRIESNSAVFTLDAWVDLSTGILGQNGILTPIALEWFKNFGQMGTFYRYCSVLSHKLEVTVSTSPGTTDSLYGAAVGFYPVNPIIENMPSSTPGSLADVQALHGAIQIQPGYRNSTKWVKIMSPQVYSCNQFIGSELKIGAVLAYVNDIGPSETLGQARLSLNVRFWEKRYTASVETPYYISVQKQKLMYETSLLKEKESDSSIVQFDDKVPTKQCMCFSCPNK